MKTKSKTTAFIGLCTALALLLAYLEVLLPPLFPSLPGIKMGLPNIVIVFLLYRKGAGYAALVSLVRILLSAMLFGNAMALLYSLAGGVLSLLIMITLRRFSFLSPVGVSIAGGVFHNVGQTIMAMFLLETTQLAYYLAVLMITGTLSGILVGICGGLLIGKIPRTLC